MYVRVVALQYWKSEHAASTCEDVAAYDVSRGLFALADGVSTAAYSRLWAETLVQHFVATPLVSDDPFEVEWWIRLAQEKFRRTAPDPETLPSHHARAKAKEGSSSTLAALRVIDSSTCSACAQLLAIGDTCVLISQRRSGEAFSFRLTEADEFDQHPICFPTRDFSRHFHACQAVSVNLEAGDTIMLASDAVARWIISRAKGRLSSVAAAFETVAQCSGKSWPGFVEESRTRGESEDDDATAIVLHLMQAPETADDQLLGRTPALDAQTLITRREKLEEAIRQNDKLRIALLVGDPACSGLALPGLDVEEARRVADAFRKVLDALGANLKANTPGGVRAIWEAHAEVLRCEPCAANLYDSLTKLGIIKGSASE
ncbi:MAG: protein phosphatase 2C domain-containing protein [Chloroflexi bacterium]|nr:protein phosphatase 2C domain-containing protein [Chloroflexota bacterium]